MRLIDFFDRGVTHFPDSLCLADGRSRFTYRETNALTHAFAAGLHARNITAGESIAVLSPNNALAFAALLAIFRLGGVWVPLNAKNPVTENIGFMNTCSVSVLFLHSEYFSLLPEINKLCPTLKLVVGIDRAAPESIALDDLKVVTVPVPEPDWTGETICSLFSTGGTTGAPKAVQFTHRMWEALIATVQGTLPVQEPPVSLVAAPMTHGAGVFALCYLCNGGAIHLMEAFDPGKVLSNFETLQISHIFLPPTAIYMLLDHPDINAHDYSSLHCFLYAAAPMSVDRLRQAVDCFGPVMVQSFGQTEAPLICTCLTAADHEQALAHAPHRLQSCGRATFLTNVAVMDDNGALLHEGETGEIVVAGGLVTPGYLGADAETAASRYNGWHRTGDMGYRDEDGFYYLVDRTRDMIISGGFNIYPSEIEQVIWSHPAVADCCVIGVPDEKWGEAVKAVVELKHGKEVHEDEILALCRDRLGPMKSPKSIEFWPELPRSAVGKVLKKAVRQKFWANAGRRI